MSRAVLPMLALLAACSHRGVSPGLERSALRAALQSQLDLAASTPETEVEEEDLAREPEVVEFSEPVTVPEPAPAPAPGPGPASAPGPGPEQALAMPDPREPEVVDPWDRLWSADPRAPRSGDADVVRAIDDLRRTMTLEARLEDKQRLIDALSAAPAPAGRADPAIPAAPAPTKPDPRIDTLIARIDALAAAQEALVTKLEVSPAASVAPADAEPAPNTPAVPAAPTAPTDPTTPPAATGAKPPAPTALSAAAVQAASPPPTPDAVAALAAELQRQRAVDAAADAARQTETLTALADLRAQLRALAEAPPEPRRGLFARREAPEPAPVVVAPAPAPAPDPEAARLREELARVEAERAAQAEAAASDLASVQERLKAFEEDQTRLDALRTELAADPAQAARLAEVEATLQALSADRAQLGSLQDRVAELAEERARLEQQLVDADAARQAELDAERTASAERAATLDAELRALRERQAAMEQRYADREQAVLARLQPLVDTGLSVRNVDGAIAIDLPSDVLFPSGSATLSADGKAGVRDVARALEPFPTLKVQVQGHTDDVPVKGPRSNWDLAFARASAVLAVLLESGLPAERVSAASFGDSRPIAPNTDPAGRARNRRIELAIELPPLEETP